MQLTHVVARDKKTATMLLYGGIGTKIDGDYFAQEINYLSKQVDEITIRINSEGGHVLQGLSIFNAILNSEAHITAQIDGVAASMAGVIPMAADRVTMNDFARIMIHDPFIPGRNTSLTPKEKKMVSNLKGILASCLTRRGMESEKMNKLMAEETWFTAQEAIDSKLIDEIISTGKAQAVESILSGIAATAITPDHFINYLHKDQQQTEMEAIAKLFGLSASATEAEVTNEIKAIQLENTALKAKADGLEKMANELKAQAEANQKKEIEALADQAIANGFFTAEQRDTLITMGQNSFDTFKGMVEGLKKPAPAASLSATMGAAAASAGEASGEKKDFEWYRRNEPEALAEMKSAQPDQFKKLYEAWEKENA